MPLRTSDTNLAHGDPLLRAGISHSGIPNLDPPIGAQRVGG